MGNPHQTQVHLVYAALMALFGICRLGAIFDGRLAIPTGFLGLWAAILLMLSDDGAVASEMALQLDVATTSLFAGIGGALISTGIIIGVQRYGHGADEDDTDDTTQKQYSSISRAAIEKEYIGDDFEQHRSNESATIGKSVTPD